MRKIVLALLFLATKQLFAQIAIGSFTTSGQKITENAVIGSVMIVKQSYQIKNPKSGDVYGRNGRKDFGHIYSIGVKTKAGIVLTDFALKPWIYDDAYKKVSKDYEPFISLTESRSVKTKGKNPFSQCPLTIGKQQPYGLWLSNSDRASSDDMSIDTQSGNKDGWLIWFIAKSNLDSTPNAEITLRVVNKEVDISEEVTDVDVDVPVNSDLILGGMYVCPIFPGGGRVCYNLVGLLVKDDGIWKLRTPFVGFASETNVQGNEEQDDSLPEQVVEEEEEIELTPVGQTKKKKK